MKRYFPILAGAALLALIAVAHNQDFLGDFKTGILFGAGVVVLILYPAFLSNHERRLAALEDSQLNGPSVGRARSQKPISQQPME